MRKNNQKTLTQQQLKAVLSGTEALAHSDIIHGVIKEILFLLLATAAMYHNSSQKKYWTFSKEVNLENLRLEANQKFRAKALSLRKVRVGKIAKRSTVYASLNTLSALFLITCGPGHGFFSFQTVASIYYC